MSRTARLPGSDMATGTCEVLERDLECPEAIEELPMGTESIPRLSREDVSKDAEAPKSRDEVNSKSHGIEKEERNKLHVIEKDLDEFVESMTETPAALEKDMMGAEEMVEKPSSASSQVPQTLPVKRKAEPCTIGPRKEEPPWDGLTLNKCILIASFVALLSMGFQVFQDVIDVDDEIFEGEPRLWAQPKSSLHEDGAGQRVQPWYFKSWLSWFEDAEEAEATVEGTQPDSPARAEPKRGQEKPSALEKKEEKPRESPVAQPTRGSKKEMQPKDRTPEGKTSKIPRVPPAGSDQEEEEEEEGEEQQHSSKRAHGEGKEGKHREGKERPRREEGKGRHPKPKSPSQGPGRKEHRHDESRKQGYKHKGEHKSGKPWEQHVSSAHKVKEGKRHD